MKKIGTFVKENKTKIIKGGLIVIGVVGGIVLIKQFTPVGKVITNAIGGLNPGELPLDGIENIMETTAEIL